MSVQTWNRVFTKPGQISKHLLCCICSEVFKEPRRLQCSHTLCETCLRQWMQEKQDCPECRTKINLRGIQKDLIASKIINDCEVYCHYKDQCSWKGAFSELERHAKNCNPDQDIPQWMQKLGKEAESRLSKDELLDEDVQDRINENVPQQGLFARLIQKAPEAFKEMAANNKAGEKVQESVRGLKESSSKKFPSKDLEDIYDEFMIDDEVAPSTKTVVALEKQTTIYTSQQQQGSEQQDTDVANTQQKSERTEESADGQQEDGAEQDENEDQIIHYQNKIYHINKKAEYYEYLRLLEAQGKQVQASFPEQERQQSSQEGEDQTLRNADQSFISAYSIHQAQAEFECLNNVLYDVQRKNRKRQLPDPRLIQRLKRTKTRSSDKD